MRGCGVRITKNSRGLAAEEGYFHDGSYVGQLWGCTVAAAREAAAEADIAANRARQFELGRSTPQNRSSSARKS